MTVFFLAQINRPVRGGGPQEKGRKGGRVLKNIGPVVLGWLCCLVVDVVVKYN